MTYFGCCVNRKITLRKEASARCVTHPVSGKEFDNAKAIIVAAADAEVAYSESEDNR